MIVLFHVTFPPKKYKRIWEVELLFFLFLLHNWFFSGEQKGEQDVL